MYKIYFLNNNKSSQKCFICKVDLIEKYWRLHLKNFKKEEMVKEELIYSCPNCKKLFITQKICVDLKKKYPGYYVDLTQYTIKSKKKTTNTPDMPNKNNNSKTPTENHPKHQNVCISNSENSEKTFQDNNNYIIVYRTLCHCLSCERIGHYPIMEDYKLIINGQHKQEIEIPVERCNICGRFYISEEVLSLYEKIHGVLLFERKYEDELENSYKFNDCNYLESTILSRCGYSTQIENPLSRLAILDYILANHKADKSEIIEILSCFIKTRGQRCYKALPVWKHDLKYVTDVNIDKLPQIYKYEFIKK